MRINLVVPLAGLGSRMVTGGYFIPKPLIPVHEKTILEWSMSSIDYKGQNLIFVVRQDAYENGLYEFLKDKYECNIKVLPKLTSGALETCINAEEYIFDDLPLVIYCPDTYFSPAYSPSAYDFKDGMILTFKANSPNYSYVETLGDGMTVDRTAEKEVISNDASVGVYCFPNFKIFKYFATQSINEKDGKEKHICPVYNKFIKNKWNIRSRPVDILHVMGTPGELEFFQNYSYRHLSQNKSLKSFMLCSDHSGYYLKEKFKHVLKNKKLNWIDLSGDVDPYQPCDYNRYVQQACELVRNNPTCVGLGFCRTGQGINIQANKVCGIISALTNNAYLARMAIEHNCANFFSFSENELLNQSDEIINSIIDSIIECQFEGGRHFNRMMNSIGLT